MQCENTLLRVQLARVCVVRYVMKDWLRVIWEDSCCTYEYNFNKIRPVGAELFHADGQIDMTKLKPFTVLPLPLKTDSRKIIAVFLTLIQNTQLHSLGNMKNFLMLNIAVHEVDTGL